LKLPVYPDLATTLLAGVGPLAAPLLRRLVDRKVRAARRG
jgi:3-dehydrosphinganine reductase